LELGAIYTKSSAINRSKDDPNYGNNIIYVPDYSLDIDMRITSGNFVGDLSYKLLGEQWTNSYQATTEHLLPAYDLLNTRIEYSISWDKFEFTPTIRVNNILNKLYEIYDHIPQPGINWEVNLGIEWKL